MTPSAEERASKYGETVQFYKNLFPDHAECVLKKREEDTSALMRRRRGEPFYIGAQTFSPS